MVSPYPLHNISVMARRKRNLPRLPSVQWSQEDVCSLLAWQDHTKAKGMDFDSTVISHLENRYTDKQISYRLSKLWRDHGPHHEKGQLGNWKRDFDAHGSECLRNEPHGIADAVLDRVARLTQEYGDAFTARQLAFPARQLRSSSRQDDNSPARGRADSSKTRKLGIPMTPRRSAKSNSLTPAVKREIGSPLGRKSPTKKSRRRYEQKVCSRMTSCI